MPGWGDILREIENTSSNFDLVRRKYLKNLSELTNRNVLIGMLLHIIPVGYNFHRAEGLISLIMT